MKTLIPILLLILNFNLHSQTKKNNTQITRKTETRYITQIDDVVSNKKPPTQKVKLHALLVFGTECDMQYAEEARKRINQMFKSFGVVVHEAKNWKEAIQISPKCHFFFYHGHGVYDHGTKSYGGLLFYDFIKPEDIVNQMVLKPNSVIIFDGVCGGAGSSASDESDIGFKEAKKRVLSTSSSYFSIGSSAYFASNKGFYKFLEDFFAGKTIGQIQKEHIEIYKDIGVDTVLREDIDGRKMFLFSDKPSSNFCTVIETTYVNNKPITKTRKIPDHRSYDYTILGKENFKISDLK
jgi:hypothetical protein